MKTAKDILHDFFQNAMKGDAGYINAEAVDTALKELQDLVESKVIGEDEDAQWQKIWDGSKPKGKRIQTIDDPAVTALNDLRAEQRQSNSKLWKAD